MTVSLFDDTASGGDASGDVIGQFENVRGSRHDDSLTGDDANNILDSRGSDGLLGDALYGLAATIR